jgi:hypothetical protein
MAEPTPRLGLKKPFIGEESWGAPLRESLDTLDVVVETIEGAAAKVAAHALTEHGSMTIESHDAHDHSDVIGVDGGGTLTIPQGVTPPVDPDTGDLWLDTATNAEQYGLFRLPLFNFTGQLSTTTSGRWYPPTYVRVTRFLASLGAPGSTATTVKMLKNGGVVGTVIIPAGQNKAAVTVSVIYLGPETDYMQMQVESAGVGAADLVIQPTLG